MSPKKNKPNALYKNGYGILVLIYLLIFISSCECVVKVCAAPFSFRVVEKQTQKDLVFGPNPIYQKDSVHIQETHVFHVQNKGFICDLVTPIDTLYLKLSSMDMDTLVLTYKFNDSQCCPNPKGLATVTSMDFNGKRAPTREGYFIFEK